MTAVQIGDKPVGDGHPCYVVGEVGVNHNASLEIAQGIIDACVDAGCDAVKFQKRDPLLQVPPHKRNVLRDTPFGEMETLAYRKRIEFGVDEYDWIDTYLGRFCVHWFASPWDKPSVDFLEMYDPPAYKVASAVLPNHDLLRHMRGTGKPLIMSSGMSTMDDLRRAVDVVGTDNLVILHCVSDYPAEDGVLNLRVIKTLREEFPGVPIGYSGHEGGVLPSLIAVARFGACMVERHVTIDRGLPGSDHGASLEPLGIKRLVRDIRRAERLLQSDGVKRVTPGEERQRERLRL